MPTFDTNKPLIVSACLLGEACRYDGKSVPCAAMIELAKTHTCLSVCPEQMGGLPTPRACSEIQPDGRVLDTEGNDRTAAFEAGAQEVLRIAKEHGCTQAILKENSPSCGAHFIYDGTFSGKHIPGEGKTAALLKKAGLSVVSETIFD